MEQILVCVMCVVMFWRAEGRLSLPSTVDDAARRSCVVLAASKHRSLRPYIITASTDFDRVPHNVSDAQLVFSADHRVMFGRGTLRRDLGGPRLTRLLMSVRYAPQRRIPAGFFVNLERLLSLQLYHDAPNSAHFSLRLSAGAFEGLSEVGELELGRLGIEDLRKGVFRGLSSVCRLDLSQNRLNAIRSDVFQSVDTVATLTYPQCCGNLTVLALGQNRLVNVSAIELDGLRSLRSVDLYGNAISRLNRHSFGSSDSTSSERGGFSSITQLNLGLNVIEQVDDSAMERLHRLRVLYLDGNMIRNVSAGMFRGLTALEALDLGANSISQLQAGVFAPLSSLKTLLLAENAIATIQTGTVCVDRFKVLLRIGGLHVQVL